MTKYLLCLITLVMFAGTAGALTITIGIQEGVHGSDGYSVINGEGYGTTELNMRIGEGGACQFAPQFYFEIPAELKAPDVVITSATLNLRSQYWQAGGTGYDGMYFKLMHYNYDTGAVSAANGNATNDPAKYTNVGGVVKSYGGWEWLQLDVTSFLQADIANGWLYSPFVTRMTDSSGAFISSPVDSSSSFLGYMGLFRTSESESPEVIAVEYTIPEPATMLLLSIGAAVLRRYKA